MEPVGSCNHNPGIPAERASRETEDREREREKDGTELKETLDTELVMWIYEICMRTHGEEERGAHCIMGGTQQNMLFVIILLIVWKMCVCISVCVCLQYVYV